MKKGIFLTYTTTLLIVFSLLLGVMAGYERLGWTGFPIGMAGEHGALMVGSFMGTLIILKRVLVAGYRKFLLIPLLNACSLPLFLFGQANAALILLVAGSAGLCYVYLDIIHRNPGMEIYVMLCGSVCWLIGNILAWKYHFFPQAFSWWNSFLLLTLVAGRFEQYRLFSTKRRPEWMLLVLLSIFVVAAASGFHGWGQPLAGASLVLLAMRLMSSGLIRKSIKVNSQNRFSVTMEVVAYIWLSVTGVLMTLSAYFNISYDVLVHTFFIGFAINMVFADSSIVSRASRASPFPLRGRVLYLWAFLLQFSLILRIFGGLDNIYPLKFWGGIFNGVFIVAYLLSIGYQVIIRNRELKGNTI